MTQNPNGPGDPVNTPASDPHDPSSTPSSSDPAHDAPQRPRTRWVIAAMAALAVALFAVPLLRGPRTSPGSGDARVASTAGGPACPAAEGKANFDFTMKDSKGANVKLSDYKGKVVLLNFWATWCGPCKVEIPEFVEVYKEYKDRGFEILGVLAMDDPSDADLAAFASSHKMTYPLFRTNEEFENAHGPLWALPTSFIIDRHGAICTKHLGPISREALEREIKGLL